MGEARRRCFECHQPEGSDPNCVNCTIERHRIEAIAMRERYEAGYYKKNRKDDEGSD